MHSEDAMIPVKLEAFRRLSTESIKASLRPGEVGSLEGAARWNCTRRSSSTARSPRAWRGHRRACTRDNGETNMKPDLFWIPGPWRGRLALMTRPRGGDWLPDEAIGWRESGLDVIVSLLEHQEAAQLGLMDESRAAEVTGIRFISFPIPDRGVPESEQAAASLINTLGEALEMGKKVAVHCRQGIGRSGMIAAAVLASTGIDSIRALETVSSARGLSVPETKEQRQWVQRLPFGPRVGSR
jgi:protein-tyrosine phosphatase